MSRASEGSSEFNVPSHDDEMSFVDLFNVVLRQRWLIVGLSLGLAGLAAVTTLLKERQYSAAASFVPLGDDVGSGGIAAFARQLGVRGIVPERQGYTSQFYVDLARSRQILKEVVETAYQYSREGDPVHATLIEEYGSVDRPNDPAWQRAVDELRDHMSVVLSPTSGVVVIRVSSSDPALSEQVLNKIVDLLVQFSLNARRARASEESRFIDERLAEVNTTLAEAERALETFLERNRVIDNAPGLVFENDRLRRQLALRQELFITLSQSREAARIDAVKDVPIVTVIDSPAGSARPEPRGTVLRVALALILGGVVGIFVSFGREYVLRIRQGRSEAEREFNVLIQALVTDVQKLYRRPRLPRTQGGTRSAH